MYLSPRRLPSKSYPIRVHYFEADIKFLYFWESLKVQWLGVPTCSAGGMGLIPGWETKILHVEQGAWKKLLYFWKLQLITFMLFMKITLYLQNLKRQPDC